MSSTDDKLEERIEKILPELEWEKWLSYETNFEKERMKKLLQKNSVELTPEELKEISKYKRSKIFANLLEIYLKGASSREEILLIADFIDRHSIEEVMIAKLTYEELQFANQEMVKLNKMPQEELRRIIEKEKQEYQTLSMVDSYILHRMISNLNHPRKIPSTKDFIETGTNIQEIKGEKQYIYVAKTGLHK